MTDQTARLLRDAANYLSALHGSVARHDNLAANFGCAGCELRDRIATELRAASSAGRAPAADRAALREAIRRAVCEAEGFAWDSDMLEPDEYGDHADAVLAALPASDTRAELARQVELRDYWHQEAMSATTRIVELEVQVAKLRRLAGEPRQDGAAS
jgi:hypothetical protein